MLSFILGNHNSTIIHCKQHNACFQKKSNYQILIQYIQKDYSFIEVFFYFIFYAFFKSRQSMNVFKCIYLSSHLHTVSTYEYMSYEKKMKQKYINISNLIWICTTIGEMMIGKWFSHFFQSSRGINTSSSKHH